MDQARDRNIQGVILDVDGTLIYSNDAHAEAFLEAMREAGYDTSFRMIRPLIGMGSGKLLPKAIGVQADSEAGQGLTRRKGEIFEQKHLPRIQATPGAKELVTRLKKEGMKLAVASSAGGSVLEKLMDIIGIRDVITDSTSSDDAQQSKPDPDIVEAALGAIGLAPETVMMLGDTPYDVEAANRCGVGVVAVRCGGWSESDLAGAEAVYADPADLLENLEASPLWLGVRPKPPVHPSGAEFSSAPEPPER